MIDRVVIDKLRAGRPGEITLYEMQRASNGLIPRNVAQRAFQDAFGKLWNDPSPPSTPSMQGEPLPRAADLEVLGATLSISAYMPVVLPAGERPPAGEWGEPPTLVVGFDDGGLDPLFSEDLGGGVTRPRLRLMVGYNWIDTWENHVVWD
jgi:hypothetical protein